MKVLDVNNIGRSRHLCVEVEKGLELLNKGENIFEGSFDEAWRTLIRKRNEGKKYHTGCDNENKEDRCGGHYICPECKKRHKTKTGIQKHFLIHDE